MMKHNIISKNKGLYRCFPRLECVDEDMYIFFMSARTIDHVGHLSYSCYISIMKSSDQGDSWQYVSFPYASVYSPRQIHDSYFVGGKLLFGATGWEQIGKENKKSLKEKNALFFERKKDLIIMSNKVFWNKEHSFFSTALPGVKGFSLFPRHIKQNNGLVLLSGYSADRILSKPFVIQLEEGNPANYKCIDMFKGEINASEMALIEIDENVLYAIIRSEDSLYMMESWSVNNGEAWTYPKNLTVGCPPHLLKLKDGRILCTFGYRKNKMGIRAIVSKEIKKNQIIWEREIFYLREDSGYSSEFSKTRKQRKIDNGAMHVGYPTSIQLQDESILTIYYITTSDNITHIASTRWEV